MIFRPIPYILTLVGLGLLVAVIFYLLERFAGINMPSSGASAVVPMMAAMMEGQAYVKRTKDVPAKPEMWRGAFQMSLLSLAVSIVVVMAVHLLGGSDMAGLLSGIGFVGAVFVLVFSFILNLLMSRLGYGMGIKAQSKVQNK